MERNISLPKTSDLIQYMWIRICKKKVTQRREGDTDRMIDTLVDRVSPTN